MRRYNILGNNNSQIGQSAVKSKKYYCKPTSVKMLEDMCFEADCRKHSSVDPRYIARRSFRDDSANALTKCVTTYISLCDGFASRVNCSGTWRPGLGKYTYSTTRRGISDVIGTWQGLSLYVEVKAGKDRQSEDQKRVEQEVTAAGAHYFLCRDFTSFVEWINSLRS